MKENQIPLREKLSYGVIRSIHWNLFWIPLIAIGICLVLSLFYRLDKNHKQIVAALEGRKYISNKNDSDILYEN